MWIEALELTGFRSLRGPDRIEPVRGLNGIVGPRGCGRSSLLGSIAWAAGEAIDEVIFNGTAEFGARGMAEVRLDFAGGPTVVRRAYRRGEEEHLVDGVPRSSPPPLPVRRVASLDPLWGLEAEGEVLLVDGLCGPLDGAGSRRFADRLRELAGRNQVFAVTDSKAVIRVADWLVGVTMESYGVSRTVGLRRTG